MFDVTQVGSWPRSRDLLRALRDKQTGRMTRQEFEAVADQEVRRCVAHQVDAGVDVIVDGEHRRDNFYSFVTDKLDGTKLMSLAEMLDTVEDKAAFEEMLSTLDVPASAIRNPTCTGKLARREPLAVGELEFVQQLTDRPVKVTLPGPYLLTRSMWVGAFSGRLRRQARARRRRGAYPARRADRAARPGRRVRAVRRAGAHGDRPERGQPQAHLHVSHACHPP